MNIYKGHKNLAIWLVFLIQIVLCLERIGIVLFTFLFVQYLIDLWRTYFWQYDVKSKNEKMSKVNQILTK